MKLQSVLQQASDARLCSIADFWGLNPGDARAEHAALVDFLYPRLQTAQYFRATFDKLSQEEKDLLWFVALHGGTLSRAELADRCCGSSVELCATLVAGLEQKGFLFALTASNAHNQAVTSLPESYLRFFELPPHWKGFLGWLLLNMQEKELTDLARPLGCGVRGVPPDKVDLLRYRVRRALLDPVKLKAYIDSLSQTEQDMLSQVLKQKGSCLYRELLDSTGQKRFDHERAEQLNNLINTRALLFPLIEGDNKYNDLLVVPRDLYYIISNGWQSDTRRLSELDTVAGASAESHPSVILDNRYALLRDLAIFGSFLNTNPVKRLAEGGVNRNDLKRILPLFRTKNPSRYVLFLAEFLISRKLVIDVAGIWRTSEAFRGWLENSRKCYWDIYNWWITEGEWSEAPPDIKGEPVAAPARSELIALRKIALQGTAGLPEGKWINFSGYCEAIMPQLTSSFPQQGSKRSARNPHHPFVTILRNIVAESLSWLGLVTLGLPPGTALEDSSTGDNFTTKGKRRKVEPPSDEFAFQPTRLGSALLRRNFIPPDSSDEDTLQPDDDAPDFHSQEFLIQPNLEIIAPPDLALDRLFFLTQFCTITKIDVMTILEITKESLRTALDSGLRGGDILDFLTNSSSVQVPETVRHLIDDCSSRHGEARIGAAGGYIIAENPLVIQEIRSNPKLASVVKDVFGEQLVLLYPDTDIARLARELRSAGLMPQIEPEAVHASTDDKFHLTLTAEELCDVVASLRLVAHVEEQLHSEISRGNAAALGQKLRTEATTITSIARHTESTARAYEKRFDAAYDKTVDAVAEKYKTQVSRLVTRSMSSRGPTKYHFRGPNPAVERKDILSLLSFATDYELEAEILYVRQNDQESRVMIQPRSFEGERLYAHCVQSDSDTIYSVDRILRAKLV